MSVYTIRIDDLDRDECPERPWTASLEIGNLYADAGFGATPADAVMDLLESTEYLVDLG